MDPYRERVISVSLNETDWLAFIQLHPQPALWLRERIQESLRPATSAPAAVAAANTMSATTR